MNARLRLVAAVMGFLLSVGLARGGESVTVQGKVEKIDTANRQIVISPRDGSKAIELELTRKTTIKRDGKEDVGLDTIKPGDNATVRYDSELLVASVVELGGDFADGGWEKVLKALQGDWLCIEEEYAGKKLTRQELNEKNRRLNIKGNKYTLKRTIDGKVGTYEGRIELDPAQKPGWFDFTGKGPGGNFLEQTGIYELNGDTLRLCITNVEGTSTKRPTEFRGAQGNKCESWIFKREPK
jgi:uncharacterized protein (TIGR03067 family)